MIRHTFLLILFILPFTLYSQEYRVKTIKQIVQNHEGKALTDTIQKYFHYKDSRLEEISITRSRLNYKNVSSQKVNYEPSKIKIGYKTFTFDSINRITKYISNGYNYRFKYDIKNRPIELVCDFDTLGIIYYNQFHRYRKTVDSLVAPGGSLYVKNQVYKYTYDYQENILTAIPNKGSLWDSYQFYYAPNFLTIISIKENGAVNYLHEFFYDEQGLLFKEIIKVFAPRLIETNTILIEYDNLKGNESFLINTYNWKYNFHLGLKTFYEFWDARY